ncbi:hypothetical protein, partial [Komagataeibacter intermedius]|uniref:hypothetical protein n=1 Tax=Komagataeibacter intermedius TaxID=66229 RepID=UPI001AE0AD74
PDTILKRSDDRLKNITSPVSSNRRFVPFQRTKSCTEESLSKDSLCGRVLRQETGIFLKYEIAATW